MASRCQFALPELVPPGAPSLPSAGLPTPPTLSLRPQLPGVVVNVALPPVGLPALPSAGLPTPPPLPVRPEVPPTVGVPLPSLVPPGTPSLPVPGVPALPTLPSRPCPLDVAA